MIVIADWDQSVWVTGWLIVSAGYMKIINYDFQYICRRCFKFWHDFSRQCHVWLRILRRSCTMAILCCLTATVSWRHYNKRQIRHLPGKVINTWDHTDLIVHFIANIAGVLPGWHMLLLPALFTCDSMDKCQTSAVYNEQCQIVSSISCKLPVFLRLLNTLCCYWEYGCSTVQIVFIIVSIISIFLNSWWKPGSGKNRKN